MSKYAVQFDLSQYNLDISADYDNPYNCDCDYIHRCGTVSNVCVRPITSSLLHHVKVYEMPTKPRQRKKKVKLNNIQAYCIDRLMHIHGCYDASKYDVMVSQGYYGQELGAVEFENKSALINDIVKVMNMSAGILEPIKYVLDLEYATINGLSKVKRAEIKTLDIETVQVLPPSFGRTKRNEASDTIVHFNLPLAVSIDDEIVDGFNRLKAALVAEKKNVQIIALYT